MAGIRSPLAISMAIPRHPISGPAPKRVVGQHRAINDGDVVISDMPGSPQTPTVDGLMRPSPWWALCLRNYAPGDP